MQTATDLDLQVRSVVFVIDRPPNPGWQLQNNINREHYVLAYAKSGNAYYDFGGEPVRVGKGNIVFIKQNQMYSARSDPDVPWQFISAAFAIDFPDEVSHRLTDALPNVFSGSDSPHMAQNFAELYRVWLAKEPGYLLKCRSLILDILYILQSDRSRSRKISAHYREIEKIVEMMRENYSRSYSLEDLCRLTGLSSSHFRALFKEYTGMTAIQFQNHLKVDRAKDLILSSCSVTEAAYAVGFSDVYYFSRMFRKLTGKNPSEYQR